METFTEEERAILAPFVSDLDKPIFVLMNLPEVVKGALFSRYSRSSKSLRRVLLDEFMRSDELDLRGLMEGMKKEDPQVIATGKAEEFYDRVLVGYGDDSVAELAGAHIAIEDVSILATKVLEDARIGLSPLEKSTRYVYFDKRREDGSWPYLIDRDIEDAGLGDAYRASCDKSFETYAALIPKVSAYVMEREPKGDDVSDRAYKATIRAKTCDILRGLLPASTLTNMGFFGDGRAYEYLLTRLYADDISEMKGIAASMQAELAKVIPSFVKRADNRHGLEMQGFYRRVREDMDAIAAGKAAEPGREEVALIEYDEDAEEKVFAYALYPHLQMPLAKIKEMARGMGQEERKAVIDAYVSKRANRRQKPGRAFEHASYTFDICSNFGGYRDLHRHRILTQQRQRLTTGNGYKLPIELVEAGYEAEFKDAMEGASAAFEEIASKLPRQAQYVVPLAYNIRWYMRLNLREAYHMLELRSAMQGHPDYRHVAQRMQKEIARVHPALASGMVFMDMKEYGLERLEAEKRIDRKMAEMDRRHGQGNKT